MPNAFTPNYDGVNDVFKVKYPQFIKTFTFRIYNRWGNVVFTTNDPHKGWNGYVNADPQPEGNYVWTISLVDINGNMRNYKGSVLLLR
jgi:gliding motility-associated-like protein